MKNNCSVKNDFFSKEMMIIYFEIISSHTEKENIVLK